MSYSSLLINTVTVRRYIAGVADAYGNPAKPWADYLVAQPCRISYPKGRQVQRGTEVTPIEVVLFTEDIDVSEHDRVVVDGVTFEILFVATIQDGVSGHHLELSLTRVIP